MNDWYRVELVDINFSEVYRWAVKEFGSDKTQERWVYYFQSTYLTDNFLFSKQEDAILFALRWK